MKRKQGMETTNLEGMEELFAPSDLSPLSADELEKRVQMIERYQSELSREKERVRKVLKRKKREYPFDPTKVEIAVKNNLRLSWSLPAGETIAIGDLNLLMNVVPLALPPFDKIFSDLARAIIVKTKGLLPEFRSQSVKKNEEEKRRLTVSWKLERPLLMEELYGVYQCARRAYGTGIRGHKTGEGWEEVSSYKDMQGKSTPGKFGIYFGPQLVYSSSPLGVMVARKFNSAAEAHYLMQAHPEDWIRLSVEAERSKAVTEVELRDGFYNRECPGLTQENFLELVVQVSSLLADQKLLDRRELMTSIFRELNRIGTAAIDREKLYGMRSVLGTIERVLILPFEYPHHARAYGFLSDSVLLVGAPGTGKTFLAHYLMTGKYSAIFASIDTTKLLQDLRKSEPSEVLFRVDKIREATMLPVVLLIDDAELLLGDEELIPKMLNLMQGIRAKGLYCIASTNHPEKIDPRFFEPGRLSKIIHVPLPSNEERQGVLLNHTADLPFESEEERLRIMTQLAAETEGWTQRFLWELCKEAGRHLVEERLGDDGVMGLEDYLFEKGEPATLAPLREVNFIRAKETLGQEINLKKIREWDSSIRDFVFQQEKVVGYVRS